MKSYTLLRDFNLLREYNNRTFGVVGGAPPPSGPPVASSIQVLTQPSVTVNNGSTFVQGPVIRVLDQDGAPYLPTMTVKALVVSGSASIPTGDQKATVGGDADFTSQLVVNGSGVAILGFSVAGLPGVQTIPFNIVAGATGTSLRRRFSRRRGSR